jgi:hypothetical protein
MVEKRPCLNKINETVKGILFRGFGTAIAFLTVVDEVPRIITIINTGGANESLLA